MATVIAVLHRTRSNFDAKQTEHVGLCDKIDSGHFRISPHVGNIFEPTRFTEHI